MKSFHSDTEPLIPGSLLTDERVTMPRIMARNIRAHAQEFVPNEICGLLGGPANGQVFTMLARTPNHASGQQHRWMISSAHQFSVETQFRVRDASILGTYHSHVGTAAEPSQSDIASMPPHLYIVIYSVADDELRVWRGMKPISLEVTG